MMANEVGIENETLLEARHLRKYFPSTSGFFFNRQHKILRAVDGVSFSLGRGETLGLVGESGCGKSTTARLVLRLLGPTGGEVEFEGRDIYQLTTGEMRKQRKDMQIIFQDPYASLNPRRTVAEIIGNPLETHGIARGKAKEERVQDLLKQVGLSPHHLHRYPHEFSGGQRQRIGIARALAPEPKLIVCDEPVSALDVSVQAQVLNLLEELQNQHHFSYLFISHNLAVVEHISVRVAVMYLGKFMEVALSKDLYAHPIHPYTKALMSAIPIPDPTLNRERIILWGDIPSPYDPPTGCRFNSRCPYAKDICRSEEPQLTEREANHQVACHLY